MVRTDPGTLSENYCRMNRQDWQSATAACPTWPGRSPTAKRKASANVADMTTDSAHRGVRLERIENSTYVVTNDRGGQIRIGKGTGTDFTAVDLLLTAIGACAKARELLPDAVRKSHDRLCMVSRTVELDTPIADRIE